MKLVWTLVVSALLAGQTDAATPSVPEGRIYVLHSDATHACPSLDWHIVVEKNDVLAGMIGWDNMLGMARATGRVNRKDNTFEMTAVELGGQERTVTVDGQINQNGTVTANIKGPAVSCTAVTIRSYINPGRR